MVDYLKYRIASYCFSILLVVLFIGGAIYKRVTRGSSFLYGVEFTGGTQIIFTTTSPFTSNELSQAMEHAQSGSFTTRQFSPHEHLVRFGHSDSTKSITESIASAVDYIKPETVVTIQQTETIGSGVGSELKPKAILAVFCALILMLIYVWMRFKSASYALANFISLGHDVLVILLFVLWFDYEISLDIVGAVLFILGYSINDTIVIFSRIRENLKKHANDDIYNVVNTSIGETLRRTILTSFFTTLVVVPLLVLGGETLKSLSSALLLGIVFGTYSSIFIASPLVYDFKKRWKNL